MDETEEKVLLGTGTDVMVDPVFHTPGARNIADLGTRGKAKIEDIQSGSEWQSGPAYLRRPRHEWPVSREFTRFVPKEERRSKFYDQLNAILKQQTTRFARVMAYSDSLDKVRGIMARFIKASVERDRMAIIKPLVVEDYEKADYIMKVIAMKDTVELMKASDLSGLAPFSSQLVFWTRGRLGPSLKKLLGPDKLAILSAKSRLAKLILIKAHREDHRRDPGDTLFRSRSDAWIVRGRSLAEKVVKECGWCNRQDKRTLNQQMGDLPPQKFDIPCLPFTNICIDLAGPYQVKAMNNARSKLKVWPVLFCCLNTGALAIYVAAGNSTEKFLTAYSHYCSERGKPNFVYSDRGSNLTKAATYVRDEDPENWGWMQIAESVAKAGTTWRFTPPGCQYRDGLAESRVKALKKTLSHLTSGDTLNYAEYCAVLARAADIINNRPLGIRKSGGAEGDLVPVTPNLLLLSKTGSAGSDVDKFEDRLDKYTRRQRYQDRVLSEWWDLWYAQVFSSLFPYTKWKKECKNVKPGDVCLVKYEKKVGKADYRISRVDRVETDDKGLVRTAWVLMRPRDSREKSLPYRSKKLVSMKVGIQRLVLICPAEMVEDELRNDAESENVE